MYIKQKAVNIRGATCYYFDNNDDRRYFLFEYGQPGQLEESLVMDLELTTFKFCL
jgi:hypothetical protein